MKKFLIPKAGTKVRDPKTGQHLPPEGAFRIVDSYFDRRIKDGDISVRAEISKTQPKPNKAGAPQKDGDK